MVMNSNFESGPQDLVNEAVKNELGHDYVGGNFKRFELDRVLAKLKANTALRGRINREFIEEWGRPMTEADYEAMIRLALGLPGVPTAPPKKQNLIGKESHGSYTFIDRQYGGPI